MAIDSSLGQDLTRLDDLSERILIQLSGIGKATVLKIAEALSSPPNEVLGRTKLLQRFGYLVTVDSHKDPRMQSISLTGKGVLRLTALKEFQSCDKLEKVLRLKRDAGSGLTETLRVINWLTPEGSKESLVTSVLRMFLESGFRLELSSEDALNFQLIQMYGYAIGIRGTAEQFGNIKQFISQNKKTIPALQIGLYLSANMKSGDETGKDSETVGGETHFYTRWMLKNVQEHHELFRKLSILGHQFEVLSTCIGERHDDGLLQTVNIWNPNESFTHIKRWNVVLTISAVWARLAMSSLKMIQTMEQLSNGTKEDRKAPDAFLKRFTHKLIKEPDSLRYLSEFLNLLKIECLAKDDNGICAETNGPCFYIDNPYGCNRVKPHVAEIMKDLENELTKHASANQIFPMKIRIPAFDPKTGYKYMTYSYSLLMPVGR